MPDTNRQTIAAADMTDAPQSNDNTVLGGRADFKLFSPRNIGKLTLKNRLVRSAAFESGAVPFGEDKGKVTEGYLTMHRTFAEGGVGLIITGYMSVIDHEFLNGQIGANHDRFIPGLTKVAQTIHDVGNDCKIIAEIGHGGVNWGPSGMAWPGKQNGHALSIEEVETFCTAMADATRRLQQAGFDGVEIHGAHHYLINAFLSPWSNRRTDKYGGSLTKRVEIVREMVGKMRDRVGPDFPILIKLNCEDGHFDDDTPQSIMFDTFPELVEEIVATDIDAIDVSGQQCPGDPMRRHLDKAEWQSYYRQHAQSLDVDVPVILGCGNKNVDLLENFISSDDQVEFVSFARPLFREPDLPNRWLAGRGNSNSPCTSVTYCFTRIGQDGMSHCWLTGKPGLSLGKTVG